LNTNLAYLPSDYAVSLHARLQYMWRTAFFELVVARTLQIIGAEIEVEPSAGDGRRSDFKAKFASGPVIVEATSPVFLGSLQKDMANKDTLLDILEPLIPDSWSVLLHNLPDIGPADSRKEFKRVAAQLLDLSHSAGEEMRRVSATTSHGDIELTLVPKGNWKSSVAGGPAYTYWGDGVEDIKTAIRRKRSQVRNFDDPVMLAINASELNSDFDCFDRALFGGDLLHVDQRGRPVKTEFMADGALSPHGGKAPTFAGILAFVEAGFRCSNEPVFYLHPRFKGGLPPELQVFQWRAMDPASGISVTPARDEGILKKLGPVNA
jgi:hypothetical protein